MREAFDLIRTRKIWDLGLLSISAMYLLFQGELHLFCKRTSYSRKSLTNDVCFS